MCKYLFLLLVCSFLCFLISILFFSIQIHIFILLLCFLYFYSLSFVCSLRMLWNPHLYMYSEMLKVRKHWKHLDEVKFDWFFFGIFDFNFVQNMYKAIIFSVLFLILKMTLIIMSQHLAWTYEQILWKTSKKERKKLFLLINCFAHFFLYFLFLDYVHRNLLLSTLLNKNTAQSIVLIGKYMYLWICICNVLQNDI